MHATVRNAQTRINRVIIEYFHRQENRTTGVRSGINFGMQPLQIKSQPRLIIRVPDDRFLDLSLGTADPLSLCWHLQEVLDLPRISSRRIARIPTTDDIQDIPVLAHPHADHSLTIQAFSHGLVVWLKRRHPLVLARLQ